MRRPVIRETRRAFSSAKFPYLEETVIPTFHFQDSLPKLPIPELEDTHKKFVYFAEPMASSADAYKSLEKKSKAFFSSVKPVQEELKKRDKQIYSSFISKPWFKMYLASRDPIMINVNPHVTFNDPKDPAEMKQATRASNMIFSALRFYKTLQDEKLSPDIFHTEPKKSKTKLYESVCSLLPRKVSFYGSYLFGAYPLDMSQYKNLFSSTRIPKEGMDELVKYEEKNSRHIIVQKGPQFFKLPVIDDRGNIVSREKLKSSLEFILNQSPPSGAKPLGVLTTMNRDEWTRAREELLLSGSNAEGLTAVDSALFAVCLDDAVMNTYEEIGSGMLHGNARNRWFDKSFQLIISKNGKASVNFEHSWGDGVAVLRFFNEVFNDNLKLHHIQEPKNDFIPQISEVKFEISDSISQVIKKAEKDADAFIKRLETSTFESDLLSKSVCKKAGVGGDGCLQMSFQLAHYLMKGSVKATYESASTSAFKHGRTETIRSATKEAKEFVETFGKQSSSMTEKKRVLLSAIKNHGRITKDALMGKGIDRHLFALRVLAQEMGKYDGDIKAFFEDQTHQDMNYWILSTSTLSSPALYAGGFGPVNEDCYGIAYGLNDDAFRAAVTSFSKDSKGFVDCLEKASIQIKEVLESK